MQNVLRRMDDAGVRPDVVSPDPVQQFHDSMAARISLITSGDGGGASFQVSINSGLSCIAALAKNGEARIADGKRLMDLLESDKIAPDIITYTKFLEILAGESHPPICLLYF